MKGGEQKVKKHEIKKKKDEVKECIGTDSHCEIVRTDSAY